MDGWWGVADLSTCVERLLGSGSGTSEEPEVYGFGSCKRGQLGVGDLDYLKTTQPDFRRTGKVPVPRKVVGLRGHRIVLLTANGDHSGALCGELFCCELGTEEVSELPPLLPTCGDLIGSVC